MFPGLGIASFPGALGNKASLGAVSAILEFAVSSDSVGQTPTEYLAVENEGYICIASCSSASKCSEYFTTFCVPTISLLQTIPYGDYLLIGLINGSVVYRLVQLYTGIYGSVVYRYGSVVYRCGSVVYRYGSVVYRYGSVVYGYMTNVVIHSLHMQS